MISPAEGTFVEAENFDRAARACGFDVFALVVHHCTNPAVCNARNNGIADFSKCRSAQERLQQDLCPLSS